MNAATDPQCAGYAGDPGASAPRCESYTGHPGRHFIRPLDYHPPDGHNEGRGSWQTDAEGYVTEPLVNRGVPHG